MDLQQPVRCSAVIHPNVSIYKTELGGYLASENFLKWNLTLFHHGEYCDKKSCKYFFSQTVMVAVYARIVLKQSHIMLHYIGANSHRI